MKRAITHQESVYGISSLQYIWAIHSLAIQCKHFFIQYKGIFFGPYFYWPMWKQLRNVDRKVGMFWISENSLQLYQQSSLAEFTQKAMHLLPKRELSHFLYNPKNPFSVHFKEQFQSRDRWSSIVFFYKTRPLNACQSIIELDQINRGHLSWLLQFFSIIKQLIQFNVW